MHHRLYTQRLQQEPGQTAAEIRAGMERRRQEQGEDPFYGGATTPDADAARIRAGMERQAAQRRAIASANASAVGQADLGTEELPIITRMGMARGGNLKEKYNSLTSRFPEAQLFQGAGGDLLFRTDRSKPWSRVDPDMTVKVEPIADIAEFIASEGPQIAGEVLATWNAKGLNLLPMIGLIAAGSTAGELADEGLQTLMGQQEQTFGDVMSEAGRNAAWAAGGAAVTEPIVRIANVGRGAGLTTASRTGIRALRAEADLGMHGLLTAGQVSGNPIIKRMESMSAALIEAFPRRYEEQREALLAAVRGPRDEAWKSLMEFPSQVSDAVLRQRNQLVNAMRSAPTTATDAGKAVQEGIEQFYRSSQAAVSNAYKVAEAIGEPQFMLDEALARVDAVAQGKFGSLDGEVGAMINTMKGIEGPRIADDGSVITVGQQLRNIRTDAFQRMTPEPGEPRTFVNKQAREIFESIDGVLNNPQSTSTEFREAWSGAQKAAKDRFATIEDMALIRASVSETNEDLARRLVHPGNRERLEFARSVLPSRTYTAVQEAFKNDLLANPKGLRATLDSYEKDGGATLAMLLSPPERRAFDALADQVVRLEDIGMQRALRRQEKVGAMISDVLDRTDTAAIAEIKSLIRKNGGKKGALGQTVRAAVLDLFASKVIGRREGVTYVVPNAVNDTIKQFQDMGLIGLLEQGDTRFMRNIDAIAPAFQSSVDMASGLQSAQVVSGLRGFAPSAARHLVEAFGAGRAFLSPRGRQILFGAGTRDKIDARGIRMVGAAIAQSARPEDYEGFEGGDE